MGGGSVLLFVFQRRFLDFYEKNYIVLKLIKNFFVSKISLQENITDYTDTSAYFLSLLEKAST